MRYVFEANIYTDGDFCLPYVPRSMMYDGDGGYSYSKEYRDRATAIDDIIETCVFLQENIHTSRDYVRESWVQFIDRFVTQLAESGSADTDIVYEEMGGNYEGTEFKFRPVQHTFGCMFRVSDEEHELIQKNDNSVTNEMVKAAVMALYNPQPPAATQEEV